MHLAYDLALNDRYSITRSQSHLLCLIELTVTFSEFLAIVIHPFDQVKYQKI